MSQKHYNADYLVDTFKIMKEIKLNSYKYFTQQSTGTILDIGCGTGSDVINLAKMASEGLQVVGLDHDEQLISIAKQNGQDIGNVDFLVSEVNQMPFQDNFLSGIRAERLIQHIENVEPVFNEVFRTLKPGAPFVIVETDWSSLCFYNGSTEVSEKIVDYLTKKKVKNGFASKKITEYYKKANFIHPHIEIYPLIANRLQDIYTYLWMDRIIEEMVEGNLLSQQEKENFIQILEEADEIRSFACSMNIIVSIAEKP